MCNPTASHTVVTACYHFDIPVSLRLGTSGHGDKGNWRGCLPFPEQISSTQVASMTDALWEPHLPYVFASLKGMGNAGFSADVHARSSCTSHVDVQGLDNSLVRLGCAQVYGGTVRTNPRRNVRLILIQTSSTPSSSMALRHVCRSCTRARLQGPG